MYKIMIVDDEENILKSLVRVFHKQNNWDIETYINPLDALKRARTCIFDAIIADCHMPGIDGLEFLHELKLLQPEAVRILMTGVVDIETLMQAINKAGAFRFIIKPWNDGLLIDSMNEGLHYRDILIENRMLADRVREQQREIISFNNRARGS